MLRRHLNFRQISYSFTSSFANPSFEDLNGSHIMYWNMMILNPSRFKVEPHSKYWYVCIERWDLLSLRISENAVLRGGSTYGPNRHPPFWQINHANSAYFRLFWGYFRIISATRPPILDLGLPFLHILDPPLVLFHIE